METMLGPRWVWSDEVMTILDAEMRRDDLSVGGLARRAGERFGIDPESAERRLRAARGGRVMDVHTADRYLVLVGRHLMDIPCYRAALAGELPPDAWPRRGAVRGATASDAPRARRRSSPPRSRAVAA